MTENLTINFAANIDDDLVDPLAKKVCEQFIASALLASRPPSQSSCPEATLTLNR